MSLQEVGSGSDTVWRYVQEPAVLIRTGIHYDRKRFYRLIGRDLYSVPVERLMVRQQYTLEQANVVQSASAMWDWQVVIRRGQVCLESSYLEESAPIPHSNGHHPNEQRANGNGNGHHTPDRLLREMLQTAPATAGASNGHHVNGHRTNGNGHASHNNSNGHMQHDPLLSSLLASMPEHEETCQTKTQGRTDRS